MLWASRKADGMGTRHGYSRCEAHASAFKRSRSLFHIDCERAASAAATILSLAGGRTGAGLIVRRSSVLSRMRPRFSSLRQFLASC